MALLLQEISSVSAPRGTAPLPAVVSVRTTIRLIRTETGIVIVEVVKASGYAGLRSGSLKQGQHWFIARLDGASVTAGNFSPRNSNVLIISTSSNQVYVFDVEAKQLGEWSMRHTFVLPRRYQEFPGKLLGFRFHRPQIHHLSSSTVLVDRDDDNDLVNGHDATFKKFRNSPINGKLKRTLKRTALDIKHNDRRNFEFVDFREGPVLFVGHI